MKFFLFLLFLPFCSAALERGVFRGADKIYIVKAGETLSLIALREYGAKSRASAIERYNGLKKPLQAGQNLRLPTFYAKVAVQSGDTLRKIAEQFLGNTEAWKQIASLNRLKQPYSLYSGMSLNIPVSAFPLKKTLAQAPGPKGPPLTAVVKHSSRKTGKKPSSARKPFIQLFNQEASDVQAAKTSPRIKNKAPTSLLPGGEMELESDIEPSVLASGMPKDSAGARKSLELEAEIDVEEVGQTGSFLNKSPRSARVEKERIRKHNPREFFGRVKKLGGTKGSMKRRDRFMQNNPKSTLAGYEVYNYSPKTGSTQLGQMGGGSLPVMRLSKETGRGGAISYVSGSMTSAGFDSFAKANLRNKYRVDGITYATYESWHPNLALHTEIGLARYAQSLNYSDTFGFHYNSADTDLDLLASVGLRYKLSLNVDLSLNYMRFGGAFDHSSTSLTGGPVHVSATDSSLGFGVHYRF